jgi:hypothetical protein
MQVSTFRTNMDPCRHLQIDKSSQPIRPPDILPAVKTSNHVSIPYLAAKHSRNVAIYSFVHLVVNF